jgi:pimeloyl-ACP methyl ester carboxylesterase
MNAAMHYREVGQGPTVLCIHSFASNLGQYRGLMERLAPRFRVVAADLRGHGQSAPWTERRLMTLADEAAPLETFIKDGRPVHLVGHSLKDTRRLLGDGWHASFASCRPPRNATAARGPAPRDRDGGRVRRLGPPGADHAPAAGQPNHRSVSRRSTRRCAAVMKPKRDPTRCASPRARRAAAKKSGAAAKTVTRTAPRLHHQGKWA